jgi:hypothetical protein
MAEGAFLPKEKRAPEEARDAFLESESAEVRGRGLGVKVVASEAREAGGMAFRRPRWIELNWCERVRDSPLSRPSW